MVNPQVFSSGIAYLEAYYKRELGEFAKGVWYKHISQYLTTEQFQNAVEAAIIHKSFLPTPDELVQLVQGTDDQLAGKEWELCLVAAQRGSLEGIDVSDAAKQALRAIGGVSGLGYANEDRLPWLKKDFLGEWKAYRKVPRPALPAASESLWAALPQVELNIPVDAIAKSMNGNGGRNAN